MNDYSVLKSVLSGTDTQKLLVSMENLFIHPSITYHFILLGVTVWLEPITADFGQEAGYTLTRSAVYCRANYTDR